MQPRDYIRLDEEQFAKLVELLTPGHQLAQAYIAEMQKRQTFEAQHDAQNAAEVEARERSEIEAKARATVEAQSRAEAEATERAKVAAEEAAKADASKKGRKQTDGE